MKAGKALNERKVEIRVQYKPPAASIHGDIINEMRNELVVSHLGDAARQHRPAPTVPMLLEHSPSCFSRSCCCCISHENVLQKIADLQESLKLERIGSVTMKNLMLPTQAPPV